MTVCSTTTATRRTTLVAFVALLLSLCLLVDTARAATATGTQTSFSAGWMAVLACDVESCPVGSKPRVTVTSGDTTSRPVFVRLYSTDPRSLPGWPAINASTANTSAAYSYGSTTVPAGGSAVFVESVGTTAPAFRWALAARCTSTTCTALAMWDLGEPTTTATPSSAAPTTSPPPTAPPTTSAPPTSAEPTPTGGSDPTGEPTPSQPPTEPPTEEPTPTPVDEDQPPTVVVISDEQWSDVLLALGALTFFSAASFVASWRHGRAS